jgi:hypothetical protein
MKVSGVRKKNKVLKPDTRHPEMWCLEFDILQCSITLDFLTLLLPLSLDKKT